jgi:predicted nucleic acid-binding protein
VKPSVYIETSVVSYLTSRPSNDVRIAACQSITADWWDNRRKDFDLFVSELVVIEATRGNEEAAARRLAVIANIPGLRLSEPAKALAEVFLREGSLPPKASVDALHIAAAATNGIDYLLTWNCTHIANAIIRPKLEAVCRRNGFEPPIICTPSELLEG